MGNSLAAECREVVKSGSQSYRAGEVCCAGLEFKREYVVSCLFKCDVCNHVSSALVWRKLVEHVSFAVKHPDAVGAVNLVTGENIEIAVQVRYVNQAVLYPLCTVNQHGYAMPVSFSNNLLYRIDGSENIGDMRDGNNPGPFGEQSPVCFNVQDALIRERNDL